MNREVLNEEWVHIRGYEYSYKISNWGNVVNLSSGGFLWKE